jgi:hypothetical protein
LALAVQGNQPQTAMVSPAITPFFLLSPLLAAVVLERTKLALVVQAVVAVMMEASLLARLELLVKVTKAVMVTLLVVVVAAAQAQ